MRKTHTHTLSPTNMDATRPASILTAFGKPGLFITGTNTDIGKTTVTAALAGAFRRLHIRVGVCKAIATGCSIRPECGNTESLTDDDLMSSDALLPARIAGLDPTDEALLKVISPIRFAAPVSPHVAARLEQREPDWRRLATAMTYWRTHCDFLLVEGAGGWLVPLNSRLFTIADLATLLALPVVVVTGAYLGTLNHTSLTVEAIRTRNLPVAGLVANRVPIERDISVQSSLDELPHLMHTPMLAVLPNDPQISPTNVPATFIDALEPFARQWWNHALR
ncbi:MAG: dethiobiotin synthase [Phycisphaerae bacterium]